MLQLCERILQFSQNSAITKIVEFFQNERLAGSIAPTMSETTVSDLIGFIKNAEYDFDDLLGASTNTMLLDLLLYASTDVFTHTMNILQVWNHRVEIAISSLQSVRLLVEPEELSKYLKTNRKPTQNDRKRTEN